MQILTVERVIRIKTQQIIIPELPLIEGLPIRKFSIEICLLKNGDTEIPAQIFESCTYHLHSSFPSPKRKFDSPPFMLEEECWGESEVRIVARFMDKCGKVLIPHRLTFSEAAYASDYRIVVPSHLEVSEYLKHEKWFCYSRSGINQMVKDITAANEVVLNRIVKTVISYPSVKDALLKRSDRGDEFVLHLGQLPDSVLGTIKTILQESKGAFE